MDACAPERFIGIDISDSCNNALIHEDWFYLAIGTKLDAFSEFLKSEPLFKRLWSDPEVMRRFVGDIRVDQRHFGEFTHIRESQILAIGEREHEVDAPVKRILQALRLYGLPRVFQNLGIEFIRSIHEVSGHLHVHQNGHIALEIDEDILGPELGSDDFLAEDLLFEMREISRILDVLGSFEEGAIVVRPDVFDAQTDDALLQSVHCCLDFGEFGHS